MGGQRWGVPLRALAPGEPRTAHRCATSSPRRGRGVVPTAFWNKEDPVHFDTFAAAATLFDWIFTTDADCIDRYRQLVGHDRVEALPFAAQPRIHNPIGAPAERLPRACFAGSWQADNYAERGADVAVLLRPVLDAGLLDIFDRMAAPGATGAPFPAPYASAVHGRSRSYADLLGDYRRYACFLNVNSVKTRPRCARAGCSSCWPAARRSCRRRRGRSTELLGDAVIQVDEAGDARAAVEQLVGDAEHRDRVGHLGYRAVMSRHTYGHRVDDVLARHRARRPTAGAPRHRARSDEPAASSSTACSPTSPASATSTPT